MRYVVVIFVIALFVFLGVLIFGHSSSPAVVPATKLASYVDTSAAMRLTIDGEINGDDAHRQIVATVSNDKRTLEIIQGYNGTVLKSESFANNRAAYREFLNALDLANFSRQRSSKFPNEQGQCPLGSRYIYEIINNGKNNLRTWSTSCNGNGSFLGLASLVRSIFAEQFTNYSEYTSDASL